MGDLQNLTIVRNGSVTVSIPRFNITCEVRDCQTGALIRTLSGVFPTSLSTFTAAEQEQLFRDLVMAGLLIKAAPP